MLLLDFCRSRAEIDQIASTCSSALQWTQSPWFDTCGSQLRSSTLSFPFSWRLILLKKFSLLSLCCAVLAFIQFVRSIFLAVIDVRVCTGSYSSWLCNTPNSFLLLFFPPLLCLRYAALPLHFSPYSSFEVGLINFIIVVVWTGDGETTMVLHCKHTKSKRGRFSIT